MKNSRRIYCAKRFGYGKMKVEYTAAKPTRAISGYYSSVQLFTNGMAVRNWLAGQSFSVQYQFGGEWIGVLKLYD